MFGLYRPRARVKAPLLLLGLFVVSAIGLSAWSAIKAPRAEAATSSYLNFQARLLTSTGTVVPDGNYHIEFKIYDTAGSGASAQGVCSLNSSTDDCWWIETRSPGNLVRVVNGYFSVQLGSVTAFGASIPWDQQLWLTMNIGGTSGPTWDGEMLSSGNRVQLTGVPYAFTAGKLQAADSGVTNVLTFATPSGGNKTLTLPNETGTVCLQSSANCGFLIGSGTAFLQGGNSFAATGVLGTNDSNSLTFETNNATQVTIAVGGATTFKNSADSSAAFAIQNVAGNNYFLVDTSGASVSVGNTGIASTVQIGNTTGAVSQTINVGNNATGSSTSNVNIGSSVAGTTAITGPTTVTNRTTGAADTFNVSNSTSTGTIAKFNDNATTVFSLADGGAALFQNQTDSTTAFRIQNAAGTTVLFRADSQNANLTLGVNTVASTSATVQTTSVSNVAVDVSASDIGQNNSIAIGVDGLPIIFTYDATNNSGDPRIIKCGNETCSSGNIITSIDITSNSYGDSLAIAVGADGLPWLAYYASTGGNIRVSKCADIACVSLSSTTDVETANNIGRNPAIAIGTDGNPWMSYWDITNSGLRAAKYVVSGGSGCASSAWTCYSVDTAPDTTGADNSIAIGTDGNPIISYEYGTAASCDDSPTTECSLAVAKFVSSGGTGCAVASWTCTILENPTGSGQLANYNDIAIGSDGMPVIAFNDQGGASAKLIRCANISCTAVASSTAADTTNTGTHISLAIGVDGLPVMAYRQTSASDLRVTKCGNLTCSSGNTTTDADNSANSVGQQTDITILPNGLPVIVHRDVTDTNPRVTRCGNSSCSASGSTYTGGISLGAPAVSFQNAFIQNIKVQDPYNPFTISTGGAEHFRLSGDGSALFKSQTANGFRVQNTTGITNYLSVNTSSGQVVLSDNLLTVNNSATQYANNGGAEDPTFTMWTSAPAGGTISRYTTAGDNIANGSASVFVDTTLTADTGVRNILTTTLTANLKYAVSFGVRHTSSTTGFTTLTTYYSRDGTNTSTTSCVTGSTTTYGIWTRITCTFTAPSSGITSSNAIFIRHSDGVEHDFYVDNLSVTISADVNHAADGSVDQALGTNWTAFDADGGAGTTTLARETTIIYDTSGSVSDVTTANANLGMRNNMTITPSVSTQYLVTFYARSSNTFNDITVGFLPAGGNSVPASAQLCTDYNTQSVSTTGWTKITCIVSTPSSGITDPDLVIYQPSATARTFYVDALTIALNGSTASNVQIGGANKGGPITLLTLDRASSAPIAANNDAYLGSMYYDTTTGRIQCYEADGWGACGAPPDNIVNLNPEYPGAVLNGSLTSPNNVGTMTADFCSNDTALTINSSLCSTGQAKNYYRWTSPQASQQTYSVIVTYQLPSTFNGFASDDTVQLTARADSTSNAAVTYEMFKSDGSTVTKCGTSETTVVTSANTWQTVGINGNEATGCSFSASSAGNFIIFKINLKAQSNANAYVSTLAFTTTGR
ncbi:hypothetical protein A3E49_03090 [Candidatus Saccharibacteria bacterium RIFCSPHIGHO2_12_FULL_49_19]|nr:MAG: hypothetical protein A3E49_03090 [Candidatus Saccharibacteria bacterium RIFCSPHIGHO2_12_FULL_49_19]